MTKVYDIKIKDLEDVLELLKTYSNNHFVLLDIFRLKGYIKRLKNEFKVTDSVDISEQICEDLILYPFYKPFYPITSRFGKSGKQPEEFETPTSYHSLLLSDEKVMLEAEEFYSSLDSTFYSYFLDFKNEAEDHLKFIEPTSYTEGETLFIKTIGEAFVFSPNYSNISKFTILIHELQHVLDFYLNPSFSGQYIIREVVAMFMEMIATDFIARKYNFVEDGLNRLQFIHSTVKEHACNVNYKMEILKDAARYYKNGENLTLQLCKIGYSEDELKFFFEQDITSDFTYPISYLIAIELYYRYYQNKDEAMAICKDLIMNGSTNNIFELLKKHNISFNCNVGKYERKICKKR